MDKIVLSEHLDVRVVEMADGSKRIEVFIDDEPCVTCVHVALALDEDAQRAVQSMDEAIANHKTSERNKVVIPIETQLQLHASNLQVWIENNYDSALIDTNIARAILADLSHAGDTRAKERYLETVLDRWQAGNYQSRLALIEFNEQELGELIQRKEITKDEYALTAHTREYYARFGGNGEIVDFVFDLKRPAGDPRFYGVLLPTHAQLIEDHGGMERLHAMFVLSKAHPIEDFDPKDYAFTWPEFLNKLKAVEHYHFKNSHYIEYGTEVFLRSALIAQYQYLTLTREGWQLVGHLKLRKEKKKKSPALATRLCEKGGEIDVEDEMV
jgi:hypothetical protein